MSVFVCRDFVLNAAIYRWICQKENEPVECFFRALTFNAFFPVPPSRNDLISACNAVSWKLVCFVVSLITQFQMILNSISIELFICVCVRFFWLEKSTPTNPNPNPNPI